MMFNRGNFVGARKYYLRKGGPHVDVETGAATGGCLRFTIPFPPEARSPIYRRIQKSQIAEVHAHHDIRRTADSEH